MEELRLKKVCSLHINGYENKEKVIEGLTNSHYIVGAELLKNKITGSTIGWANRCL
ncbi:hypothetical protein [Bacillus smithii]|uniref:hypothetical protein n=1 Tax=Bacillus smithii TaxID=1479 RepID=UPI003D23D518